jgi:pimeloyl-ACP methyl ester carboxylesterase
MAAEPRVITYPIPANDDGGLLHIYGGANAKNIIICCGGYPDDHKPFTPLARRLASEADSLVGITCFPGFDLDSYSKSKFNGFKRTGYSFEEVCNCIREAVSRLFTEWKSKSSEDISPKFTLILHDWGVVPGLMFANRTIEEQYSLHVPNKIVLLDILTPPHKQYEDLPKQEDVQYSLRPSMYELLVCISYRFALAASFAVLRYASDILGLISMALMFGLVHLLGLNPARTVDSTLIEKRAQEAKFPLAFYRHLVYMSYPYYYLFKCFIIGKGLEDISLPLDLKSSPILYIYGTDKNVMFHDWRSLAILEREERENRSACKVVKVEEAGHWMYVQKLEVCVEEIKSFIIHEE